MARFYFPAYWQSALASLLVLALLSGDTSHGQEIITHDGRKFVVPAWEAITVQQAKLPEEFADAKFKTVDLAPFKLPGTIDVLESMEVVRDGPFGDWVGIKYTGERSNLANISLEGTHFPTYMKSVHSRLAYELGRERDIFDAEVDFTQTKFLRFDSPQALLLESTVNGELVYQGRILVTSGDYRYLLRFDTSNQLSLSRRDAMLMLHIARTIQQKSGEKLSTVEYVNSLRPSYYQAKNVEQIRSLLEGVGVIPSHRYDIFTELTHLESVNASRTPMIDDRLLAALRKTTSLKWLILDGSQITDKGMKHLAGLTNLQSLSVANTSITDEGLKSIGQLKSLESLNLAGTEISDQGLAHLSSLTELSSLDLSDTNISDQGLAHVRLLSQLNHLRLAGTKLRGEGLNDLRALDHLERLELDRIDALRPGAMESLSTLKGLSLLSVAHTKVTPRHLQHLSGEHLEALELDGTPTSDDDLKYLARFTKLYRLDLSECNELTGQTLSELAGLDNLNRLQLPASVKSEHWPKLIQLPGLTEIRLRSRLRRRLSAGKVTDQQYQEELAQQKRLLQELKKAFPDGNVDLDSSY
ncbi:hypothetical protein AB1K70_17340 [Bremerella sp. JC770]|uniref:leucine-rich repeat domain-containing protein n=1 Tax=Bremerella sp. JC770 TaxID=3232137 RepID=UPI00345A80D5